MLRITSTEEESGHRLTLEGRLEGPWVEVLRNTWEETRRHNGKPILLDLGGVSFVDGRGRELFCTLHAQGAAVTNASPFLQAIMKISGIEQQSSKKGE